MASRNNVMELKVLARILTAKYMTVARVADAMDCSTMVVYRRIRRLEERGCKLEVKSVREGLRGPEAKAYRIIPNRASKKLTARGAQC